MTPWNHALLQSSPATNGQDETTLHSVPFRILSAACFHSTDLLPQRGGPQGLRQDQPACCCGVRLGRAPQRCPCSEGALPQGPGGGRFPSSQHLQEQGALHRDRALSGAHCGPQCHGRDVPHCHRPRGEGALLGGPELWHHPPCKDPWRTSRSHQLLGHAARDARATSHEGNRMLLAWKEQSRGATLGAMVCAPCGPRQRASASPLLPMLVSVLLCNRATTRRSPAPPTRCASTPSHRRVTETSSMGAPLPCACAAPSTWTLRRARRTPPRRGSAPTSFATPSQGTSSPLLVSVPGSLRRGTCRHSPSDVQPVARLRRTLLHPCSKGIPLPFFSPGCQLVCMLCELGTSWQG